MGFVRYIDMDHINNIEDYKKLMMVMMAGKIAEEEFYGISSMGAMSDLQRLNDITYRMFYHAGFSSKGNITISLDYKNEYIFQELEKERVEYTTKVYNECKELLLNNKLFFDEIVKLLLIKKVIHNEEICEIYDEIYKDEKIQEKENIKEVNIKERNLFNYMS